MKLPDLPSEILLAIIDLVCPDDLVNLVLGCRKVYELAYKRLIKHRDYINRYSKVKIHDTAQHGFRVTYLIKHACVLLYDIQEDDDVKYYIRSIEFSPGRKALLYDKNNEREDVDENVKKLQSLDLDSMLSPWLKDIDRRKQFKEVIMRKWTSQSDFDGNEEGGAAFVLLLSMLPNVKTLELVSSLGKFSKYLQELLAATTPWDNDDDDGQGGAKPLQKVEYLNVEHWDTEGSEGLEGIGDLIYLPNLKEISGMSLEHGDWDGVMEPPLRECSTHRSSTITKVMLVHSLITPSSLFQFIRPMSNLRSLDYEHGGILLGEKAPDDFVIERYRTEFVRLADDWLQECGLVTRAIESEIEDFGEDLAGYGEGCVLQVYKIDQDRDQ